jgi:hypothetical protein
MLLASLPRSSLPSAGENLTGVRCAPDTNGSQFPCVQQPQCGALDTGVRIQRPARRGMRNGNMHCTIGDTNRSRDRLSCIAVTGRSATCDDTIERA